MNRGTQGCSQRESWPMISHHPAHKVKTMNGITEKKYRAEGINSLYQILKTPRNTVNKTTPDADKHDQPSKVHRRFFRLCQTARIAPTMPIMVAAKNPR